ncbi:hypothetical protein [Flavobacterium crassostreae]|uniref:hypothetical protein n=1 Tax=Flavobacterium crassostreae TaxID=1763534 RepID=UPI0012FE3F3B|nr:hypothetical protein [Flavobacterium crassostreae]
MFFSFLIVVSLSGVSISVTASKAGLSIFISVTTSGVGSVISGFGCVGLLALGLGVSAGLICSVFSEGSIASSFLSIIAVALCVNLRLNKS